MIKDLKVFERAGKILEEIFIPLGIVKNIKTKLEFDKFSPQEKYNTNLQ